MSGQADIEALAKAARAGSLKPLVLIFGNQDYLVRQAYDRVLEALVPEELRGFNLEQHDGARAEPQALVDSLATPPMLPGPKAVGVYDARYFQSKSNAGEILEKARERFQGGDAAGGLRHLGRVVALAGWTWDEAAATAPDAWAETLELDAADAAHLKAPWFADALAQGQAKGGSPGGGDDAGILAEGLEGLLEHWVEGNHLVCACASADQRKKLTKLFAEKGEVLDFRQSEKSSQPAVPPAPFLRQLLNQRKLTAPNAVAQRMVAAYGSDLGLLSQELAKLEAHAWPRTDLTDADLAAVGSPRPEENVFKLIDALGQQKLGEALRLTRDFIAADPDARYQLMGLMIAEVRKLLFMRALIDENKVPARGAATFDAFRMQVHPRVGKELPPAAAAWWKKSSPWALHQTLVRARGFKTSQLAALLPLLADGDLAFKTGRRKPEDLLEELCARLCGVREEAAF